MGSVRSCRAVRGLVLGCVLLAAAMLGGCGGDDEGSVGDGQAGEEQLAVPWLDPDGEFPVVGALTVNTADGMLWMATNPGLFRIRECTSEPERVTATLTTPDGSGKISEQL